MSDFSVNVVDPVATSNRPRQHEQVEDKIERSPNMHNVLGVLDTRGDLLRVAFDKVLDNEQHVLEDSRNSAHNQVHRYEWLQRTGVYKKRTCEGGNVKRNA